MCARGSSCLYIVCVCAQGKRERDKNYVVLVLEKNRKSAALTAQNFFFEGRETPARGRLESFLSLVFQSATLELPRALSRLFSLGREASGIKKSAQKIQKRRGLRRELGGKTKPIYARHVYIYTTREPTGRERNTQKETSATTTTSRERPFC